MKVFIEVKAYGYLITVYVASKKICAVKVEIFQEDVFGMLLLHLVFLDDTAMHIQIECNINDYRWVLQKKKIKKKKFKY